MALVLLILILLVLMLVAMMLATVVVLHTAHTRTAIVIDSVAPSPYCCLHDIKAVLHTCGHRLLEQDVVACGETGDK